MFILCELAHAGPCAHPPTLGTPAAPSSFVASNRAARRIAAVQDSQLLHLLQSFLKSLQCAYNIHRHGTGEIQKHEEASGDHPKALNSVHDGAPHNHMAIFAVLRELRYKPTLSVSELKSKPSGHRQFARYVSPRYLMPIPVDSRAHHPPTAQMVAVWHLPKSSRHGAAVQTGELRPRRPSRQTAASVNVRRTPEFLAQYRQNRRPLREI